jgi:quinol monooxygenase YgiN
MAVVLQQVMPEGVSLEMLDQVTDEMGADSNPPDGILFHVHFEQDGRTRIIDVWESQEAYEAFRAERLMPAMQAVAQRQGMDAPPAQPEESILSVHRLVRGH